ncbi:four helix bundle protein [Niabella drilacis]|uniref:Four helix bundle protein n=1 Tax=Niabella drilacis (strain DSM 25811 / CCM 8410 / CCUG 62505 / LMG 26954 / E90) TaxID=1285928 RepID=A0A1G6TZN3_NIADE|nr:four helix bundle protein [Niabella drilacis]SDD34549.1 four helix bundle protein [Niabella drilacis]
MENTRRYELEDPLAHFAALALNVCDILPSTKAGNNLEHQLSKNGTAFALMYGAVQAAESQTGFIHKMKCALKELRETKIHLGIIKEKPVVGTALREWNELIAIFAARISAAQKKRGK